MIRRGIARRRTQCATTRVPQRGLSSPSSRLRAWWERVRKEPLTPAARLAKDTRREEALHADVRAEERRERARKQASTMMTREEYAEWEKKEEAQPVGFFDVAPFLFFGVFLGVCAKFVYDLRVLDEDMPTGVASKEVVEVTDRVQRLVDKAAQAQRSGDDEACRERLDAAIEELAAAVDTIDRSLTALKPEIARAVRVHADAVRAELERTLARDIKAAAPPPSSASDGGAGGDGGGIASTALSPEAAAAELTEAVRAVLDGQDGDPLGGGAGADYTMRQLMLTTKLAATAIGPEAFKAGGLGRRVRRFSVELGVMQTAYAYLAKMSEQRGDAEGAHEALMASLRVAVDVSGQESVAVAVPAVRLARHYLSRGLLDDAQGVAARAVDILRSRQRVVHALTGGRVYEDPASVAEGDRQLVREAVSVQRVLGQAVAVAAEVQEARGSRKEAAKLYDRSAVLLSGSQSPHSGEVLDALTGAARCLAADSEWEKALLYTERVQQVSDAAGVRLDSVDGTDRFRATDVSSSAMLPLFRGLAVHARVLDGLGRTEDANKQRERAVFVAMRTKPSVRKGIVDSGELAEVKAKVQDFVPAPESATK